MIRLARQPDAAEKALRALLEQLVQGSTRRRRGRPRDGFARASMHNHGVRAIMQAENVGITRAVEFYARSVGGTVDHIWVALRHYWKVMEEDDVSDDSVADDDLDKLANELLVAAE